MSSSSFPPAGRARPSLSLTAQHSPEQHPLADLPDHEIAAIARAKLEEAYKTQKYRLHRFLRREVGADFASDMVQDAFLRMANTRQVHQIAEPGAYLWRVARNLVSENWRKQKHDNVAFVPIEEALDIPLAPEQEWALELADLKHLYKKAIDSLPDKTRYVFLMCRIDGLSHKQISEELGITIATVEYHMGKALTHLARAMDAPR